MTKDDMNNINYPLVLELSKYLNVEVEIVEITWEEAFMINGKIPEDLETNPSVSYNPDVFKKVDLICSTFTVINWRKKIFDFAETLNSAELLLVKDEKGVIKDFSDLQGKSIALMQGTTFESNMNLINKENDNKINLVLTNTGSEAKDKLNSDEVVGIILDADEALNFNKQSNMKYNIALPVSPMTKTAWTVEKGNLLKGEVEDFFRTIESNGVLNDLFQEKFNISYSAYIEKISKNKRREKYHRDLDEILKSGKLVVALRERRFIYLEGGEKQPMHALAEEFADYLGVSLEYVISPSVNKYWETENGLLVRDSAYTPDWFNYFDVACEIFSRLDWREKKINFVPVYPSEYSVIAKKSTRITNIKDLLKLKCVTSKGSAYEDLLSKNKLNNFFYESTSNFLSDVNTDKADYTIMDNVLPELPNYPDLEPKLSLGAVDICWGLRKDQPLLEAEIRKFMNFSQKQGLISVLLKAMDTRSLQSPDLFIRSYYERHQPGIYPSVLYGAENGLPQEDIYTIFQDRKGYIWIGTNTGAVRYNGREMKPISIVRGLNNNSVLGINQDSTGKIYFATPEGIAVYENDTIAGQHFEGLSFSSVYIDRQNNKWFTGSDSICLLTNEGEKRNLNREFKILPKIVLNVTQDLRTNDIYFTTPEGVYIYYERSNEVFRLTEKNSLSIFIDNRDSAWISTDKGLFIGGLKDLRYGEFSKKSRLLNKDIEIQNEIIRSIGTNKFGSIWLVSDSRIFKVISSDQPAIQYEQTKGLKNNRIMSFLIDNEDNIWIGFSGGLQRLSNKNGLRNFYPSVLNSYIYSVTEAGNNKLWISSNNGLFIYNQNLEKFNPDPDKKSQTYVINRMSNGNIICASNKELYIVDNDNLKNKKRAFSELLTNPEGIFVSSSGEIFILTGNSGLLCYFPSFDSDPILIENKLTVNIFQLIEIDGHIIGGNSNGIVEFDQGKVKLLTDLAFQVFSLYNDNGILWIGTESGLGCISDNNFSKIQFSPIGNNNYVKSVIPAKNRNYLWLGTNSGFVYFSKITREAEFIIDSRDGLQEMK
ncbi:MAG: transporter substrate-binding domain-containing protein [Bacteroidetes bacterium]|nr:transporter substrate-binding domain-containing protein [Bacteroidota bacterium]